MVEAVDARPHSPEKTVRDRPLPPLVAVVFDGVKDFIADHRPGDSRVTGQDDWGGWEEPLRNEQERREEDPEDRQGVNREGRVFVLFDAGDGIAVQDDLVWLVRYPFESNRGAEVVITMTMGKAAEEGMDRAVQDITVKSPFEKTESEVNDQERQDECAKTGRHLLFPKIRPQEGDGAVQHCLLDSNLEEKPPD